MKIPNKAVIRFEYNDEVKEYFFDMKELNDIIKEKQERIDKAKSYLEYDINGMKASIRTWEKVKEETEVDTDYITNMLEREKRNYEMILKILKGELK